ncbi:unnamed protein product [Cylindrotheca closterium]|uniref:Glyoxalase domain-containing protein 4 n=1 Tax=Cylindrotheca closterium TaxID=2856 RepID=A0AAD2FFY1_9STRA|nr:unnamed protein product [Cylindrotheca closterium]
MTKLLHLLQGLFYLSLLVAINGFGSITTSGRCFGRSPVDLLMTAANSADTSPSLAVIHHTAIKTRNITLAIQFYGLLDFEVTTKFRAGPAKAAWLEQQGPTTSTRGAGGTRLELIEVPSHILNEPEGQKCRAIDLMQRQDLLGMNHFALDVTGNIKSQELESLSEWMENLNEKSLKEFGKTLRIALSPRQQMIGRSVYELAFLYDADGALVELLNKQRDLPQEIDSGWEPLGGANLLETD